jgi:hypothetical protein
MVWLKMPPLLSCPRCPSFSLLALTMGFHTGVSQAMCRVYHSPGVDASVLQTHSEEVVETLSCYFPVRFTPPKNDPHGITRKQVGRRKGEREGNAGRVTGQLQHCAARLAHFLGPA